MMIHMILPTQLAMQHNSCLGSCKYETMVGKTDTFIRSITAYIYQLMALAIWLAS